MARPGTGAHNSGDIIKMYFKIYKRNHPRKFYYRKIQKEWGAYPFFGLLFLNGDGRAFISCVFFIRCALISALFAIADPPALDTSIRTSATHHPPFGSSFINEPRGDAPMYQPEGELLDRENIGKRPQR